MDWLLTPRPDPTVVFFPGRCGAAFFIGQPGSAGPVAHSPGPPRFLARAASDLAGSVPSVDQRPTDQLDIRGYSHSDWTWLWNSVPAGHAVCEGTMARISRHPGRLLGGLCLVSAARTGFRLYQSWSAKGLAVFDDRVCRALE